MSADSVQFHLEKMVPELEDLQERGIFTTTEIKSIVKQRTAHEYRVHRIIPLKSDFLRYIAFEQNLERLRRKRRKRMGLQEDNETHEKKKQQNAENGQEGVVNVTGVSDYSIMRRIHGLYAKMLKKFSGDVDLWIQYLNWSISVNSSKALSMQFAKAIQLHPTKPVFWIMAAKWEFEKNNNVAAGRVLMQRGIRINPESQKLWAEYFKLELLWIERIKERRKVLFKDDTLAEPEANQEDSIELPKLDDEPDSEAALPNATTNDSSTNAPLLKPTLSTTQKALLSVLIPRAVYRNAIKAHPTDLAFRLQFLDLYRAFGAKDTREGLEEVYESLRKDFMDDARTKAILAEQGLRDSEVENDDPRYPSLLQSTVAAFEAAVKEIGSIEMWQEFAHFLAREFEKATEKNIRLYLSILLFQTFDNADQQGVASESMYMLWYNLLCTLPLDQLPPQFKITPTEVLHKAIGWHSKSAAVWIKFIEGFTPSTERKARDTADEDGSENKIVRGDRAKVEKVSLEVRERMFTEACRMVIKEDVHIVWFLYLDWLVDTCRTQGFTSDPQSEGFGAINSPDHGDSDEQEMADRSNGTQYNFDLTEPKKRKTPYVITTNQVHARFTRALSRRVLGNTPHATTILQKYIDFGYELHGIDGVRAVYELYIPKGVELARKGANSALIVGVLAPSVAIWRKCIDLECAAAGVENWVPAEDEGEEQVGDKRRAVSPAADGVPAKKAKSVSKETSSTTRELPIDVRNRIRILWDRATHVDPSNSDLWLAYIRFELSVTCDFSRPANLHWQAEGKVPDQAAFARDYEALKASL